MPSGGVLAVARGGRNGSGGRAAALWLCIFGHVLPEVPSAINFFSASPLIRSFGMLDGLSWRDSTPVAGTESSALLRPVSGAIRGPALVLRKEIRTSLPPAHPKTDLRTNQTTDSLYREHSAFKPCCLLFNPRVTTTSVNLDSNGLFWR